MSGKEKFAWDSYRRFIQMYGDVVMKVKDFTEENLEIGEELYMKYCKSCHGKEGYGDGSKAAELEGDLGDFSSEEFHGQTDGSLFYKISEGRDDMPGFTKKIPDEEDRWLIVNYVRTLEE